MYSTEVFCSVFYFPLLYHIQLHQTVLSQRTLTYLKYKCMAKVKKQPIIEVERPISVITRKAMLSSSDTYNNSTQLVKCLRENKSFRRKNSSRGKQPHEIIRGQNLWIKLPSNPPFPRNALLEMPSHTCTLKN